MEREVHMREWGRIQFLHGQYAGGKFNAQTSDILDFNVKMMNGLDKRIKIIYCYSYLVNEVVNFETFDGVHYTYDTSMIIYNYIQRFIP